MSSARSWREAPDLIDPSLLGGKTIQSIEFTSTQWGSSTKALALIRTTDGHRAVLMLERTSTVTQMRSMFEFIGTKEMAHAPAFFEPAEIGYQAEREAQRARSKAEEAKRRKREDIARLQRELGE